MARGSSNNRVLVKEAARALDQFKYEVASEIGVNPPASGYWGDLASRDCGAVGGQMVRRMIQQAEHQLAGGQATAAAPTAFGRFGNPQ
ncbi:MAG: alpha/beta-type small acid-soluble spore protein [Bacillota bacterium]|nr:alpha/beta-type small acid-soluble spore protein [Bacillota bacterium]